MPSAEVKEATRREWRELCFFYERDDLTEIWRIGGYVHSLRNFARLVRDYALEPDHESLSEHQHFGPYMYLEIGSWNHPEITNNWIAGPLRDLFTLASLIENVATRSAVGDRVSLRHPFAPQSAYDLIVEVQDDAFDPARADPHCW